MEEGWRDDVQSVDCMVWNRSNVGIDTDSAGAGGASGGWTCGVAEVDVGVLNSDYFSVFESKRGRYYIGVAWSQHGICEHSLYIGK